MKFSVLSIHYSLYFSVLSIQFSVVFSILHSLFSVFFSIFHSLFCVFFNIHSLLSVFFSIVHSLFSAFLSVVHSLVSAKPLFLLCFSSVHAGLRGKDHQQWTVVCLGIPHSKQMNKLLSVTTAACQYYRFLKRLKCNNI